MWIKLYVAVLYDALFVKLNHKRKLCEVKGVKDLVFLRDRVHVN